LAFEAGYARKLEAVVRALSTAHKVLRLYPPSSPIPGQSVESVVSSLDHFFADGEPLLSLAVAREGFEARPAALHVANRSPDKAAALVQRHAALAAERGVRLGSGALGSAATPFDVVLNSSASSLGGAEVPVSDAVLQRGTLAVDLMYGSAAMRFTGWARELGATPRDGLGMLVEQAAEAFFVWRAVMPDTRPVLHSLRAELGVAAP